MVNLSFITYINVCTLATVCVESLSVASYHVFSLPSGHTIVHVCVGERRTKQRSYSASRVCCVWFNPASVLCWCKVLFTIMCTVAGCLLFTNVFVQGHSCWTGEVPNHHHCLPQRSHGNCI